MSRKKTAKKRKIVADPVYDNVLLSKLINRVMYNGKKSVAQKEVYKALDIVKNKGGDDPILVFEKAVESVKPEMEVRARRIGGAAYQVPVQVRSDRQISLAIRWIVGAARNRPNSEYHTFAEKLAQELLDASKEEGGAIKKRQEVERQAEANKAFSHFKW